MTQEQSTSIINLIDEYSKLNIEEIIKNHFSDTTDLKKIVIQNFTLQDILSRTSKLFQQLKAELNSPDFVVLPMSFNAADQGVLRLDTVVGWIKSYTEGGNFRDVEQNLIWLSNYAQQFGFYDRTKFKMYPIEVQELESAKSELLLQRSEYDMLKNQYLELKNNSGITLDELNQFLENVKKDFASLEYDLSDSKDTLNKINDFAKNAEILKNKIDSTLEFIREENNRVKKNSIEIEKQQAKLTDDSNEIITNLQSRIKDFDGKNSDFEKKLKIVSDKTKYFQERNEILDNLIGREVGASLFETFKQRKGELRTSIVIWALLVITMSVATFILVLALFTNFFGKYGNHEIVITWENLLSNFLKSSPAFFLLYYCISQYNKERNFKEEYAFKSAVALTVNAYADVLIDDNNKDQLVLSAVNSLYKSPTYISNNNINKKDVNNMIDLLSKALDNTKEVISKK